MRILLEALMAASVPGRKTDVKDCEWLAQLLEHGLLVPFCGMHRGISGEERCQIGNSSQY
jgi:hypothetical protein